MTVNRAFSGFEFLVGKGDQRDVVILNQLEEQAALL